MKRITYWPQFVLGRYCIIRCLHVNMCCSHESLSPSLFPSTASPQAWPLTGGRCSAGPPSRAPVIGPCAFRCISQEWCGLSYMILYMHIRWRLFLRDKNNIKCNWGSMKGRKGRYELIKVYRIQLSVSVSHLCCIFNLGQGRWRQSRSQIYSSEISRAN